MPRAGRGGRKFFFGGRGKRERQEVSIRVCNAKRRPFLNCRRREKKGHTAFLRSHLMDGDDRVTGDDLSGRRGRKDGI